MILNSTEEHRYKYQQSRLWLFCSKIYPIGNVQKLFSFGKIKTKTASNESKTPGLIDSNVLIHELSLCPRLIPILSYHLVAFDQDYSIE